MLKDIPHCRGVFIVDTLPKRIFKSECGVVNSDTIGGEGKHWLAHYNDTKSKHEFFDSYGLYPCKEILKYLKTSGKDILYNSSDTIK